MSIWTRIRDALSALRQGESLTAVFDRLRAPPERTVAFTIAVIALGAKMAKADGEVTRTEVAAFRRVFTIPEGEEANAARVYNLARQDVAGFDAYARRIAAMFGVEPEPPEADCRNEPVLIDVMDGLFEIAVADGGFHPAEEEFLREVARIFGLGERCFRTILARHVADAEPDPYEVLGVAPDAPMPQIRAAWRSAVRDSHPDRMMARGVPPEAVRLAERRLVAVNRAWERIGRDRAA